MRAGLWRSIALMALMTIASAARAEPVTLVVFYAFAAFAKFHEPIAQEFMKRHPDIKIVFRAPAPTYDDGHQAMMRAALTHRLPDVYYSGYDLLEELVHALVKQNDLVDLGPLLAAEGHPFRQKNYSDRMLELGTVDGKLYGLPFNASTPILYYNADLVKKAGGNPDRMPDTWDATVALAAKIKALGPDIAGLVYGVQDYPCNWLYHAMIMQAGGVVVDGRQVPLGGPALGVYVKFVTGPEAQKIVVETTGYMPTNLRATEPQFLGAFYDQHPNDRTAALQMDRAARWVGYPAGNSVRIWRAQRDVISAVMRGDIAPNAGYEKIVKDTAAMMAQ